MISRRLKTIASFVNKNDKVVDIGTDHGLLAIFLYKNKLCSSIIASDVNDNALRSAKVNIRANKLEEEIPTIISDGFSNLDMKLIDTAVIAGMGRTTISNIIDNSKSNYVKKYIIQTNNEHAMLRKYMDRRGLFLNREIVLKERNKFYIIMEFIKSDKKNSKQELEFGLVNGSYRDYYTHVLLQNSIILNRIPRKKIILRAKQKKYNNNIKKIIKKCA